MFECKYKFELEDSLISAKYVYKSQRRKRDKAVAIMLPILLVAMVAMLVYDIFTGNTLVWDIILIVALCALQVMYLIIPLTISSQQKKAYNKQNLAEMDYLSVVIDNTGLCTETLIKDNNEVAKNAHSLRSLTSYIEDDARLILVFNRVEYVCLKKEFIKGGVDKLKTYLEKSMQKSNKSKK